MKTKFNSTLAKEVLCGKKMGKFFLGETEVEVLDPNFLFAGNCLTLVKVVDPCEEHDNLLMFDNEGIFYGSLTGIIENCGETLTIEIY